MNVNSKRAEARTVASIYTSRPCALFGQPLYWAVTGSDGHGGAGVMAWCWDEADAKVALGALCATGDYSGLMVENLSPYSSTEADRDD